MDVCARTRTFLQLQCNPEFMYIAYQLSKAVVVCIKYFFQYERTSFNEWIHRHTYHHNRLWPFFRDYPDESVPEENFWTLWCKGRLTQADTMTIRLGATPSGLTSAHLHHPPIFFTGWMPFLPPNQQRQSTEGNIDMHTYTHKNLAPKS